MNIKSIVKRENGLMFAITAYCSACFYHFMHSTVFIDEYSSAAGWVSAVGVTIAWIGVTCILLVCFLLVLRDKRYIALIAVAVFGVLSFDGLSHYSLQPVSAHTSIINITIWVEVVTAWIVLLIVTGLIVSNLNNKPKKIKLYNQKKISGVELS